MHFSNSLAKKSGLWPRVLSSTLHAQCKKPVQHSHIMPTEACLYAVSCLEADMQHGIFHIDELWRRLAPEDVVMAKLQKEAQASAVKAWHARHSLVATTAADKVSLAAFLQCGCCGNDKPAFLVCTCVRQCQKPDLGIEVDLFMLVELA